MASISKRTNGAWQNTSYGIRATATDTITTLPTTIYGDGTPLLDYLITGNTVQNGTPTPNSPIMPQGCGELENGQYKIPISSTGQTNNIYLGEVPTTRKIKKLVLTGTENFSNQYGTNLFSVVIQPLGKISFFNSYCTHYKYNPVQSGLNANTQNGEYALQVQSTQTLLAVKDVTYASPEDFKTYLAAQYAAGTPVTVWYVLATEETAVVNEPLMRVGDYADTVSKAQAGVAIPTNNGSTTVNVETTLKPSEVYIKYMG